MDADFPERLLFPFQPTHMRSLILLPFLACAALAQNAAPKAKSPDISKLDPAMGGNKAAAPELDGIRKLMQEIERVLLPELARLRDRPEAARPLAATHNARISTAQ